MAPHGTGGLFVIILSDSLLLLCAGAFNPTFATYRMNATSDDHMARVNAAWSISSKAIQPVFIAAAGLLAAATSPRTAIAVAASVLLASVILLPWRTPTPTPSKRISAPHPRNRSTHEPPATNSQDGSE